MDDLSPIHVERCSPPLVRFNSLIVVQKRKKLSYFGRKKTRTEKIGAKSVLRAKTDEWKRRWVTGNVSVRRKESETEPNQSGMNSKISNLTPSVLGLMPLSTPRERIDWIGAE
jgi:hypothetical protein